MGDATTNPTTSSPPAKSPLQLSERVRSLRLPDRAPLRVSPLAVLPWLLCVILAGTTAFFALRSPAQSLDGAKNPAVAQPNPLATPNGAPARDDDIALESKGHIIPFSLIQVSPKVGGMVMELFIAEGKKVKQGDVLAKLETKEFLFDRDRSAAQVRAATQRWEELWKYRKQEVQQARADLNECHVQLVQLEADWRRAQELKKSLSLSPKEVEQAESTYKAMKSRSERLELALVLLEKGPRDQRIAAAKAEKEQADAELEKAQWKLDNCTVRAPVSGVILSKKTEQGNMVNPAAFSNGLSASICEMADLTNLEVELSIAERDIAKIFVGQNCKVRPEAYPDRSYVGVVSRLMPIADRAKASVSVRVAVTVPAEEEGMYLRPDTGALVNFFRKK